MHLQQKQFKHNTTKFPREKDMRGTHKVMVPQAPLQDVTLTGSLDLQPWLSRYIVVVDTLHALPLRIPEAAKRKMLRGVYSSFTDKNTCVLHKDASKWRNLYTTWQHTKKCFLNAVHVLLSLCFNNIMHPASWTHVYPKTLYNKSPHEEYVIIVRSSNEYHGFV